MSNSDPGQWDISWPDDMGQSSSQPPDDDIEEVESLRAFQSPPMARAPVPHSPVISRPPVALMGKRSLDKLMMEAQIAWETHEEKQHSRTAPPSPTNAWTDLPQRVPDEPERISASDGDACSTVQEPFPSKSKNHSPPTLECTGERKFGLIVVISSCVLFMSLFIALMTIS